METEEIADLSDCLRAIAIASQENLVSHERAFEVAGLIMDRIESQLKEL